MRTEIATTAVATGGSLPAPAAEALKLLGREIDRLETRLALTEAKLIEQHKANADSRRLSAIPGVGPISAISFALRVDASQFRSGRHPGLRRGRLSRPGSGWCRANTRPAADSASAGSAGPGTNGCASCSCWAPPRSFASPNPGVPMCRPRIKSGAGYGCSRCWSAVPASSRRWLWPTKPAPAQAGDGPHRVGHAEERGRVSAAPGGRYPEPLLVPPV